MSRNDFGLDQLGAGEATNFFSVSPAAPLECLSARFRQHAYAPHTHDSFVVGTIISGCETFMIDGSRCYAGPGDLCLVSPAVVHDGRPAADGYAYRITYPTTDYLLDVTSDAAGRRLPGTPSFPDPIVRDPELARVFAAGHRLAEERGESLEADEFLLQFFVRLLLRHGRIAGPGTAAPGEPGPVSRAMDYLDAHFAEMVDLVTLAGIAGIPRTRLIRAFNRQTGLTPHAWLTDRRVRHARAMLATGAPPAAVAAACGFYDQSHLNRAFKARVGVAPGAFQAGHRRSRAH
ncbi:AraC family transcriptional regulator [Reyranella sp.]|uniref:AraC family transcriptional regulator n=1 Tax=Reyranella sp. TaxID=1929291 RepID=UPI003783C721